MRQTPVFGKCSLSVARDGSLGLADQHGEAEIARDDGMLDFHPLRTSAAVLFVFDLFEHDGDDCATCR